MSAQPKLGLSRFLDPHVDDRLITEAGEYIVDEIRRHWITRVWPGGRVVLGMVAFGLMPWLGHLWWAATGIGVLLGVSGFWGMHSEFMDRFVITNQRVFRVKGVLDQRFAAMPLSRILDLSMQRPFWGQVFGYATFVFESAAQDQGLKEIPFVGDPDARLHTFSKWSSPGGPQVAREPKEDVASGD